MFKWWWRFNHSPDALWVSVVKAIYGNDGVGGERWKHVASKGPWSGVVNLFTQLRKREMDLLQLCPTRMGNGNNTCFWKDKCLGDRCLIDVFPRVYLLDNYQRLSVRDRVHIGCEDFYNFPSSH